MLVISTFIMGIEKVGLHLDPSSLEIIHFLLINENSGFEVNLLVFPNKYIFHSFLALQQSLQTRTEKV